MDCLIGGPQSPAGVVGRRGLVKVVGGLLVTGYPDCNSMATWLLMEQMVLKHY